MSNTGGSIADQTAALELEKLKAEIAQLLRPASFIERNWQSLVTAFAAILAACGGRAALVTAASQTVDLWTHIGQQRELVALETQANNAERNAVDSDRKDIAAQKSEFEANRKLLQEMGTLAVKQQQLNGLADEITYEKKIVIPSLLSGLEKQRNDLRTEIVALQQQLNNTLRGAQKIAAQKAVDKLAATVKTPTAQKPNGELVYIEYADTSGSSAMQKLQSTLVSEGYVAPGAELVQSSFLNPKQQNEVRYFDPNDKQRAQALAKVANGILSKVCPKHPPIVAWQHYSGNGATTQPLEIWTGFGCPQEFSPAR